MDDKTLQGVITSGELLRRKEELKEASCVQADTLPVSSLLQNRETLNVSSKSMIKYNLVNILYLQVSKGSVGSRRVTVLEGKMMLSFKESSLPREHASTKRSSRGTCSPTNDAENEMNGHSSVYVKRFKKSANGSNKNSPLIGRSILASANAFVPLLADEDIDK